MIYNCSRTRCPTNEPKWPVKIYVTVLNRGDGRGQAEIPICANEAMSYYTGEFSTSLSPSLPSNLLLWDAVYGPQYSRG